MSEFSGSPAEWDAFVRRQEGWTHFHLHGWKRVIEDVHGHECRYLASRAENGDLTGVLPLVRVRSPVFGHFLVSMPFLNYGGPLGSARGVAEVADEAARIARDDGVDLLELRRRAPVPDGLEGLDASHHKITVLKDLPDGDPEILWDDLDGKIRNQVRKPRKEGVEVQFGPDQLDGFWEVYSLHMRNLGTPVQPWELFERILDEFGDDVWLACARLEGKPIACGYGLRWDDEVEMTWASDLFEYRSIAPNMLLYWAYMERAIEEGLSVFNFGRCTPDSGTHRFKRQWGTRDQQLWWYQLASDETAKTPSPDDEAWSWGPKLWRKMPLPVANRLGPAVVRYIP